MTQATDITLAPNISGTTQRTEINDIVAAIVTGHSGASRPSYLTDPGTWTKEVSGTVHEIYYFDGTDDILMGTVNFSANTFVPSGQLGTFANAAVGKTADFTAVVGDFGKLFTCNATSAVVNANIDPTAGLGTSWFTIVQKVDSSANAVVIDPDSTDTINGATTLSLTRQWDAAIVIKTGATTFAGLLLPNAAAFAPLASPALTGNPTAPTQSPGNNSTRVATTAYADAAAAAAITGLAPLASPALTGNPTAPTPSPGDNDTSVATTAFVAAAVAALSGGIPAQASSSEITSESNVDKYIAPDLLRHAHPVAKAWARITGVSVSGLGSLLSSYGVASITNTAGSVVITFAAAMSGSAYAVVGDYRNGSDQLITTTITVTRGTTTLTIAGSGLDRLNVVVYE